MLDGTQTLTAVAEPTYLWLLCYFFLQAQVEYPNADTMQPRRRDELVNPVAEQSTAVRVRLGTIFKVQCVRGTSGETTR